MAMTNDAHVQRQPADSTFAFGKNWARFLTRLTPERVDAAEQSMRVLLGKADLRGCRMLDAGSGSGLFSLAANRLGAEVVSFDVDPDSVACTRELKNRYGPEADTWRVISGSLLDTAFLNGLGDFDIVYCWGVAHHTGAMWQAIENLSSRVRPDGMLVLAIYNDQQYISRMWKGIKRIYQRLPAWLRPVWVAAVGGCTFLKRLTATLIACLLRLATLRNPLVPMLNWIGETQARGMHGWYDLVDWVGGWPFEVAKPEDVFRFLRDRGFVLQELTTCSGHGCNEFVFVRTEKTFIKPAAN